MHNVITRNLCFFAIASGELNKSALDGTGSPAARMRHQASVHAPLGPSTSNGLNGAPRIAHMFHDQSVRYLGCSRTLGVVVPWV